MQITSPTVRVDSDGDEYQHQVDEEADVLEQADRGVAMRPVDNEVIQTSVDTQQDAAAAAAADDDDDDGDDDDGGGEDDDGECDVDKSQPRNHISYQPDTFQSQDDANVDDVQRKPQSSESEATEVCVQADTVESGDSDQEKLDKECQTFCDTSDHQCQTLEQQYQLLDEQCQPLEQHSEEHVHHQEYQQFTSDQHRHVLALPGISTPSCLGLAKRGCRPGTYEFK